MNLIFEHVFEARSLNKVQLALFLGVNPPVLESFIEKDSFPDKYRVAREKFKDLVLLSLLTYLFDRRYVHYAHLLWECRIREFDFTMQMDNFYRVRTDPVFLDRIVSDLKDVKDQRIHVDELRFKCKVVHDLRMNWMV